MVALSPIKGTVIQPIKNRIHVESIERKNVCLIHQAEGIGSNPPSVAVTVAWRQVLLVAAELVCDTVSSL